MIIEQMQVKDSSGEQLLQFKQPSKLDTNLGSDYLK